MSVSAGPRPLPARVIVAFERRAEIDAGFLFLFLLGC